MRPTTFRAVGSAAIILWLALIVASYYVVHKPFGPENVLALVATAADLVSAATLVLLATAAGRRILARVQIPDRLELLAFSAGLGLGLASLSTLGLAWIGLPGPIWGYLGSALLAVVLRYDILAIGNDLRSLRPDLGQDRLSRLLSAYVLIAMGSALILALLPPTAWDGLFYHLKGPSLLLQGASYTELLKIPPLASSSLIEHLFLAGMWLRGDGVASLLHWSFSGLTLAVLWRLASPLGTSHRRLVLAIMLSGLTWVFLAGWPYVDWALGFYAAAAFLAVQRWSHNRDRSWLVLSGVMVGLAMAVKYTAALPAAAVALLVLSVSRTSMRAERLRSAAIFAAAATVMVLPFLLRNWAFTGNPIYPALVGGLDWDAYREWRFTRPDTGLIAQPVRLLLAPLEATVLGTEGKVGYEASLGPLFLGLVPLAAVAVLRDYPAGTGRLAGLMLVVTYVLWLAGLASSSFFRNARLLLPMFPLLSLMTSSGLEQVQHWRGPAFSLHRLLVAVVLLVLALNAVAIAFHVSQTEPWRYLLGQQSREEYLTEHLGSYYEAMTYLNQELPASAGVQFLWEPRSYYCDNHCWPDATLDRFSDLVFRHRDLAAIAGQLREEGATHLLLFETGMNYMAETDPAALPAAEVAMLQGLLASYFEPVRSFGTEYTLYAWK